MKVYVDTSVLLSLYFKEAETEGVQKAIQVPQQLLVSGLVFVELASTFRRAARAKRISKLQLKALQETARKDLRHFRVLSAGEELFRQAALVADQTGLRTLDAVHLASARMGGAEAFWTFDRELATAASKLGFHTIH